MKKIIYAILLLSSSLAAQEPLKLRVVFVETTATEKVYNFVAENFVGFVGWQFQMEFDGTKMRFKEVRYPIHPSQGSQNFNEPNPGELRYVWLDTDLESNDYLDATVLFQLVFDLLEPEGSPLCFRESQEYFEFIFDKGVGDFTLAEILISDDCYQGFSIFFENTATENPATLIVDPITDVFLSTTGMLSFTSSIDPTLSLSLFDAHGKVIASFASKEYAEGRHNLHSKNVTPGLYLLQAKTKEG